MPYLELAAEQVLQGRYKVVRLLGEGGMGRVYLARDLESQQDVAVKVPNIDSAAMRDRFDAEIRRVTKVDSHPNVLRLLDSFQHEDVLVLVYEYAPGGSLEDRVRSRGREESVAGFTWLTEIAEALDVIHSNPKYPTVHCDVKPANILFGADGTAKLADFGIAVARTRASGDFPTIPVHERMASAIYTAPEVTVSGKVSSRADQYSLAMTAAFACAGDHPRVPLSSDDRIAPKVRVVLSRATCQDPEKRFKSCKEFAGSFLEALVFDPLATRAIDALSPRGKYASASKIVTSAAVLSALALSVLALTKLGDYPALRAEVQALRSELGERPTPGGAGLAGRVETMEHQLSAAANSQLPFLERSSPPIGAVVAFAGAWSKANEEDTGWMLCDGRELDARDLKYKDLYAAVGQAHGFNASTSRFRIPDYRGMFLRGVQGERKSKDKEGDPEPDSREAPAPGASMGNLVGSLQRAATAMPTHPFSAEPVLPHTHEAARKAAEQVGTHPAPRGQGTDWLTHENESGPAGDHGHKIIGGDLETRPANLGVHWLIKFRVGPSK